MLFYLATGNAIEMTIILQFKIKIKLPFKHMLGRKLDDNQDNIYAEKRNTFNELIRTNESRMWHCHPNEKKLHYLRGIDN